jgi:uncharacterized protein YhfF
MSIPATITDFWERFNAATGGVDSARFYEAFHFCDTEELANSLAELVLAGTKRATAGSLWAYEHEGQRAPQPGDLSVVTNWAGSPLCVIETMRVDIVPFKEVTAEFAATEGEGDGSLEYWRDEHARYFSRECARIGRVFSEDMLVACERFKVVFVGPQSAA